MDRNELAFAAAAKVHQAWCEGEMNAFYGRMVAAHETIENPGDAVRAAGMKNGAVRNVVEIDAGFMQAHSSLSTAIFTDRQAFDAVVKINVGDVKYQNAYVTCIFNPETNEFVSYDFAYDTSVSVQFSIFLVGSLNIEMINRSTNSYTDIRYTEEA